MAARSAISSLIAILFVSLQISSACGFEPRKGGSPLYFLEPGEKVILDKCRALSQHSYECDVFDPKIRTALLAEQFKKMSIATRSKYSEYFIQIAHFEFTKGGNSVSVRNGNVDRVSVGMKGTRLYASISFPDLSDPFISQPDVRGPEPQAPPPSRSNARIDCPPGSSQTCQWCKNNPDQASNSVCSQYTAGAATARAFPSCYSGPALVYTDAGGNCLNFSALKEGDTFLYRGVPITYSAAHSGSFAEMVREQYDVKRDAKQTGSAQSPATIPMASKSNSSQSSGTKTYVDTDGSPCVSISHKNSDRWKNTSNSISIRHNYTITNKCEFDFSLTLLSGDGGKFLTGVQKRNSRNWFCTEDFEVNQDCKGGIVSMEVK